MCLQWDGSGVEDWEGLHEDEGEWRLTECLLWASMEVCLKEITEENVLDWVCRLKMVEGIYGPHLQVLGEDKKSHAFEITEEHIRRRVGLTMNVFPETDAGFFKALERWYVQQLKDIRRRNIV